MPTLRFALAVVLVGLSLASCGGSSGGSQTPPVQAPSGLSYVTPQVLVMGNAAGSIAPTVSGTVSSYTVTPSLPAGLSLNAGTGVISGTPTAISGATNYTVTATNAGGMTTASISISVTDVAPAVAYGSGTLTFTKGVAVQPVAPSNTGGAALTWSVSPALPAGLSFSTSDGSISGTPTAAAASAVHIVTAENSGGSSTFNLTVVVEAAPLLELGHADSIQLLRSDGTHVLSQDTAGHWVLWNSAATMLASGDSPCTPTTCLEMFLGRTTILADMAGQTIVIETPSGLEVRSSSDGHLLSTISTPLSWWKLSADGSYICGGSASALSVWTPSGQVMTSRSGDYSKAIAFAAPPEVRVANGPAGQNVIETVSLPAGTALPGPSFQGTFAAWFQDGERFLTATGNTVWTYSKSAVQQDITTVGSVSYIGGAGSWFWSASANGSTLNIYAVGASSSPAATYPLPATADLNTVAASGTSLAILDYGPEQITVVDLSGASPVKTVHPLPVASTTAYAAVSSSQWMVGNLHGVLLDGASLASTPKYFGYGQAWSIAGSATRTAIATASGRILYFDAVTDALQGTIDFPSSKVELSSTGALLAAAGDENDGDYHTDWSVIVYSLPSQTPVNTFPYTAGVSGNPLPIDIALSSSGTALGQALTTGRQVTAVPGGSTIWSDTLAATQSFPVPIRLSPDGTLIAAADSYRTPGTATKILKNGTLATAVSGSAVGWIDNNRLLVNSYTNSHGVNSYSSCSIYDATGVKLTCPALPELLEFRRVTNDSIYSPALNSILSLTNAQRTWVSASPSRGVGAVSGTRIVFASGARVLAESY